MKPQPYHAPKLPDSNSSTWSLIALLALACLFVAVIIVNTSCAPLDNIPFSVSYQDANGEVYTITKGAVIRAEK